MQDLKSSSYAGYGVKDKLHNLTCERFTAASYLSYLSDKSSKGVLRNALCFPFGATWWLPLQTDFKHSTVHRCFISLIVLAGACIAMTSTDSVSVCFKAAHAHSADAQCNGVRCRSMFALHS